MDEYDDLATGPDKNWRLSLSFNNWEIISSDLYSYTFCLRSLDVSHNLLAELSPEFGNLTMLRELNLSNNRLQQIDPIVKLKRLRLLNVSHNSLTVIPRDIGQCVMLVRRKCCFLAIIESTESANFLILMLHVTLPFYFHLGNICVQWEQVINHTQWYWEPVRARSYEAG